MPDLKSTDLGVGAVLNMTLECKTVQCFQEAVAYFDDNFLDVISHVVAEQMQMEPVKIGLGRSQLFALLYTLVGVAAGLIIVGTVCLNVFFRCIGSCVLWPVSFFFLLLGTILYPSTILMSDTCGSIEHLGYTIVESDVHLGLNTRQILVKNETEMEDYLDMLSFRNFTTNYLKTNPIPSAVLLPGLPALLQTYFGTCVSVDGNVTVEGTVRQVGRLAENVSLSLMDFGSDTIEELGGELRPSMETHLANLKGVADDNVYLLFENSGALVGCDRFNKAYFEMKDAFCCEFVVMLYWMAMSSCLIGCCGCWGSCATGFTVRTLRPRHIDDDLSSSEEEDEFDKDIYGSTRYRP